MKKNWSGYRSPKTTNEMRQYYDAPEYVRAKRRPANLPSTWDDIYTCKTKTWKHKRKTQYRHKKRGAKHVIVLDHTYWINLYYLEEYLESQDIAYVCENIYEKKTNTVTKKVPITEKTKLVPSYTYNWNPELRHQVGYHWEYRTIGYKTVTETYSYNSIVGHKLIYWTDKNLDLDNFLYHKYWV